MTRAATYATLRCFFASADIALFYNPRGQSGPACNPVSLYIAGGLSASEAA